MMRWSPGDRGVSWHQQATPNGGRDLAAGDLHTPSGQTGADHVAARLAAEADAPDGTAPLRPASIAIRPPTRAHTRRRCPAPPRDIRAVGAGTGVRTRPHHGRIGIDQRAGVDGHPAAGRAAGRERSHGEEGAADRRPGPRICAGSTPSDRCRGLLHGCLSGSNRGTVEQQPGQPKTGSLSGIWPG